jgi:peroxiredoxin
MRIAAFFILPLTIACSAADVDAPWGDEMDSDNDGLDDATEYDLGTDPDNADSDGDGFDDGDEFEQGADPTDGDDRPYLGGWAKDRSCSDEITPTGNSEGDVTDNFALTDQFGDTIHLYDFCGRVVLLVGSTEYCGQCVTEAPHLADLYNTYADRGLMIVTLYGYANDGETPGQEDLAAWAETHGQDFPVVADPGLGTTARFVTGNTIGTPSLTLLAPGAVVAVADNREADGAIVDLLPY